MSNRYSDKSDSEVSESLRIANWALQKKYKEFLELSFEVSDVSEDCRFGTMSEAELLSELKVLSDESTRRRSVPVKVFKAALGLFPVAGLVTGLVLLLSLVLSFCGR